MTRANLKTVLQTVESVAIILVAGALLYTLWTGRATREVNAAPRPPGPEDVREQRLSLSLNNAATMGSDKADVALIEFADFQCPFCGQFARDTVPRLRSAFVDTTMIRFSYKHLPLEEIHPFARRAAEQAACAARQSQFWSMHDALFAARARLSDQFFARPPAGVSVDTNEFSKCLDVIGADIDADAADGRRLGVTATPTFFLGRVDSAGRVQIMTRLAGCPMRHLPAQSPL